MGKEHEVLNDSRGITVVIICIAVLLPLLLIMIRMLRNNRNNLRMKDAAGIYIDAKVIAWRYLLGRPTRYVVKVEYSFQHEKVSKMLVTSGRFAAKYEHQRDIQVVVIPDTGKVCFAEEDWRMQNIGLILFIIMVSFMLFLLICTLALLVVGRALS